LILSSSITRDLLCRVRVIFIHELQGVQQKIFDILFITGQVETGFFHRFTVLPPLHISILPLGMTEFLRGRYKTIHKLITIAFKSVGVKTLPQPAIEQPFFAHLVVQSNSR